MTNNNAMPKAMPIAEISHILARIGILRSLHASAVANRFKLNPTEVKIMGYVKSNTLKRGVSDILDCYNIGESSASRSISRLEGRSFLHKRSHPYNQKYMDLVVSGEGIYIASYILVEQRKYVNELFEDFTHDERITFIKLLWKMDYNLRKRITEYRGK